MKLNRLLGIVLTLSMLFTPSAAYSAVQAEANADNSTASALFEALGITINTAAASITRSEFAKYAALAAGSFVSIAENDASGFEDVKASSESSKYIKAVCSVGIMNGVGKGSFAPNAQVSGIDAVVALVRLAGYEPAAVAYGGYPGGYLRVALDKGIADGLSVSAEPVTGAMLARLIYNTLHTDVYQLVGMGDTVSYAAREGEDVLYVYHDITTIDAKVTANRYTSLYHTDTICMSDEIALDNERYKASLDMADYLGMAVTAYCKKSSADKIGTVVAIAEDENVNSTITLKYEDIDSIDAGTVSYFDGTKERKANLERGFSFIYNGKLYEDGTAKELHMKDSVVTLIDGDGDKLYETASLVHGQTLVVTNIDRTDYVIYGQNQIAVRFDSSEPSSTFIITDKNGSESYIDRIKNGNVITVFASKDSQYIKAIISTDTVKGRITEMDLATGKIKLTSGKEVLDYEIASGCESDFAIGLEGEFYVDAFGKLVYSSAELGSDYEYGYIISGMYAGPMSPARLLILNSVDFEEFECAQSVVIDGTKTDFSQSASNVIYSDKKFTPQLIRYKTDSNGIIKYIDTENAGTGDESSDRLTPDKKVAVSGSYTPYFPTIESRCQIGADTLLIKAPSMSITPAVTEDVLHDTKYYSNTRDMLNENRSFSNAYAYELDDTLTPKAIVYYSNTLSATSAGKLDDYSPMAVVLEHFRCLDKNGDPRDAIRVFTDAMTEEILYFNDEYTDVDRSMEFGDIILYILDQNNCITQWAYDFDYSSGDVSSNTSIYSSYFTKYVGYPYAKGDNAFSFLSAKNNADLSEDRSFLRVFPTKVMKFVEVDLDTKKAARSSYEYVESYKHSKNPDNKAFVKVYRGGGNYEDIMFVYKK